jgi:hypothetical protein
VLSAVKRCSSAQTFSLAASDFSTTEPRASDPITASRNGAPVSAPGLGRPQREISPLAETARADSVAALMALGFGKRVAQDRVNAVHTDARTTEEIVRAALRAP